METDGFAVPDGFKSHEDFLQHQYREQHRLNKEQFERDLAESKSNDFGVLMLVIIIAIVIIAGLMGASI